jgi:FKBP-type peptidyl-prolyl cis-trans isomerase
MKNRIKLLCVFGFVVLLIWGCNPKTDWIKQERLQIESYIASLGDTAYVLQPSGLYYIELLAGTGRSPIVKDTVFFKYIGMYLDRQIFDSNLTLTTPYAAVIGNYNLITGLEEGFMLMKEGGKARFLTPSSLAYGSAGWYIIPGFTPLLWEVTLTSVRSGTNN